MGVSSAVFISALKEEIRRLIEENAYIAKELEGRHLATVALQAGLGKELEDREGDLQMDDEGENDIGEM